MSRAAPLPDPIADGPFSIKSALALGVSRQRLRAEDLEVPFRGVRTLASPHDLATTAGAFAQRMRPGHVFAGLTAARLWGLPVTSFWNKDEPLVVGIPAGTTRTRARAARTREFDPVRLAVTTLDGLPILDPAATVMSLAKDTDHVDLVVLLDALSTPSKWYPDLRIPRRPFSDPTALAAFADRCRGLHGALAFRRAADDARVGAGSPRETRTRLAITAAGFPEPVLQHEVWHDGEKLASVDLAYPRWKIAIEYDGEGHLEPGQWAKDIRRYERLEALGWIVLRVTKSDLHAGARTLIARLRSAVARRT